MLLLRPLVLFIAVIFFYMPNLEFIGIGLLLFIYHIILKNRNEYVERVKKLFSDKNIEFPENIKKTSFIPLIIYIFSLSAMFLISFYIYGLAGDMESIAQLEIPEWIIIAVFASSVAAWASYVYLINKIVRDQVIIQEKLYEKGFIKTKIIKYRNGNLVMIMRLLTFNLYEWLLIYSVLRETAYHYIESGVVQNKISEPKNPEPQKTEEIISELHEKEEEYKAEKETAFEIIYNSIISDVVKTEISERYSFIFSKVTKLDRNIGKKILDKMLNEKIINKEDYDRINNFI